MPLRWQDWSISTLAQRPARVRSMSLRVCVHERVSNHAVPLLFKVNVANLVRPDGSADRLPQQDQFPVLGMPRVVSVPVNERRLARRVFAPFLHRHTCKVSCARAERESSKVDHANLSTINEPVARLPVAMRGHKRLFTRRQCGERRAQSRLDGGIDGVGRIEPGDRTAGGGGIHTF